jgi:membrane protease YdiL (CAAX protease family)
VSDYHPAKDEPSHPCEDAVAAISGLSANASPSPAPEASLWTWRDLALFVAFALLALFFANFVTLAGYAVLRPWMGWHLPIQAAATNTFVVLVLQGIFYALMLAYIYILVVYQQRRPFWQGIRWRSPQPGQGLRLFLSGMALAFAVSLAPVLLPDKRDFPFEKMFSSAQAAYALAAFAIFVAPFMEELIFRGVIFSVFEARVGTGFAVAGTAVLFAVIHIPEYWGAWNRVLLVALAGLAFSWVRARTGSLASSVILHCAYNTTLMLALFFQTRHFRSL